MYEVYLGTGRRGGGRYGGGRYGAFQKGWTLRWRDGGVLVYYVLKRNRMLFNFAPPSHRQFKNQDKLTPGRGSIKIFSI